MVSNKEYALFAPDEIAAELPIANVPAWPDGGKESCLCVFLEDIEVIDGVCRRQTLSRASDLITGDEYRFPDVKQEGCAKIRLVGEEAIVQLQAHVEVGRATVRARRTHSVTLMSETAHVVQAVVLETTANRVILALGDKVLSGATYALIAVLPTLLR